MTMLVTGASGYVGQHLLAELSRRDTPQIRAMGRNPDRLELPDGIDRVKADAVSGEGLDHALEGVETVFYLIHSMGPDGGEFAERDRQAAHNYARAARESGVKRTIYLGGLGPTGAGVSEHLRSRHEVAEILQAELEGAVYVRAAMIIGPGSASFEMVRHLVKRLPLMITPRWVDTRSQPIAISDVVKTLADLAALDEAPSEVQLGGPDVLTYREMMQRSAAAMGRRPPVILKVPVLTPRLSSYWVQLVTPVDGGLVRPLVDGLKSEMIVERAPRAPLNQSPLAFEDAVKEALSG